jgi:hypothetical protein
VGTTSRKGLQKAIIYIKNFCKACSLKINEAKAKLVTEKGRKLYRDEKRW